MPRWLRHLAAALLPGLVAVLLPGLAAQLPSGLAAQLLPGLTVPLPAWRLSGPVAASAADTPSPPCTFASSRGVVPVLAAREGEVTLTIGLGAECIAIERPLHLVLVVDASDRMGAEQLQRLTEALRAAISAVDFKAAPGLRVGVVIVSAGKAQVRTFLTDERSRVINALPDKDLASGPSRIDMGLNDARRVLRNGRAAHPGVELREAILVATAGLDRAGCDALRSSADEVKSFGALVVTACVGRSCEQRCLSDAASHERFAFRSWDWGFVGRQVTELVSSTGPSFHPVVSAALEDRLSDSLLYSGGGYPSEGVGNHLEWRFSPWPAAGISITYQARVVACGRFRASSAPPEARVTFNTTFWGSVPATQVVFRNPMLQVPCPPVEEPTPTPAATSATGSTPTAAGTTGATPTDTPAGSASATPTSPPAPRKRFRAYLPSAIASACLYAWPAVDTALVIDVSGSMMARAATRGPGTRLDVARTVGEAMLGRLEPGRDRVAVVVYGDEELLQVLAPLADCCGAARMALQRLPRYNGSRMDLAIDAAAAQLLGPTGRSQAGKVMVVLSDGDLNRTPLVRLTERAAAVRAAGVALHVVGIGDAADEDILAAVTGSRGRVYLTRQMPPAVVGRALADVPMCRR